MIHEAANSPTGGGQPVHARGPVVLIAVDGAGMSRRVVTTAHRLFGDSAEYLAINVRQGQYSEMSWAYVSPVPGMSAWYSPTWEPHDITRSVVAGSDNAADSARGIAAEAGLPQATPLGDIGDPATAIIRAAHQHHADVVVIGADVRGWFSHIVKGSVEHDLLRDADFAVLVVADHEPADEVVGQ